MRDAAGQIIRAKAFFGRAGYLPHWRSEDGGTLWSPDAFLLWREIDDPRPGDGEPTTPQMTMAEGLRHYIEWHGGIHDDECPEDDTCACSWKPTNDAVNAAYRYLVAAATGDGERPSHGNGLAAPDGQRLREALEKARAQFLKVVANDGTTYKHGQVRRSDGKHPSTSGGSCWLTPAELARVGCMDIDVALSRGQHSTPAPDGQREALRMGGA